MKKKSLDLVIPIYNESKNINNLLEEIKLKLSEYIEQLTVILIDDGSTDDTESVVKSAIMDYNYTINYIKFVRNCGKEIAVKCGLDHSNSDYCVIMDGDLQHPPECVITAFKKIENSNNDLIYILPTRLRKLTFQRFGVYGYKKALNTFSKNTVYLTDFTLLTKKAVNLLKQYNEANFYTRGILSLIGLKSEKIYYNPRQRLFGETKFTPTKLISLAIDGIVSVSIRPLRIAIYLGLLLSCLSIIYGFFLIMEKITKGQPIPGFATLGFGLFFLGGIQLFFMGIIGEYIGKMYIETKNRPLYSIDYILENKKSDSELEK
jgi:polyisoprenyl-phosphate glycosyltransferase